MTDSCPVGRLAQQGSRTRPLWGGQTARTAVYGSNMLACTAIQAQRAGTKQAGAMPLWALACMQFGGHRCNCTAQGAVENEDVSDTTPHLSLEELLRHCISNDRLSRRLSAPARAVHHRAPWTVCSCCPL